MKQLTNWDASGEGVPVIARLAVRNPGCSMSLVEVSLSKTPIA